MNPRLVVLAVLTLFIHGCVAQPTVQFEPEKILRNYRKGSPLPLGKLKVMPEGGIVWATYRETRERSFRVNGAYRIRKLVNGWMLEDGSSFSAEFEPSYTEDDDLCLDECCGEGELRLYRAVMFR